MLRSAFVVLVCLLCGPVLVQAKPGCHRVQVNGLQLYYEVSGRGEPIVVLHGAHMNIDTMGKIIPLLAQTHRVYALEFQGHGRTNDIDRPITMENLAEDVAGFMDAVKLEKADVFGYSLGGGVALRLAMAHPEKVDQLIIASASYDEDGWQPEFKAMIPEMTPEMFASFEPEWRKLAPNPDGFAAFIDKMIALEHEPLAWGKQVEALKHPTLIIAGDADVVTLEHIVSMFKLRGGGAMGDMGVPLSSARLAVLPATSHTAVITQHALLHAFIEPFLQGETPKGMFE